MTFDLDELERIGTSAIVHCRIPCDLSKEPAVNRFIAHAVLAWQPMIDELRRLRLLRESLAKEIETGRFCRSVDHHNGCCDCGEIAKFVRGQQESTG